MNRFPGSRGPPRRPRWGRGGGSPVSSADVSRPAAGEVLLLLDVRDMGVDLFGCNHRWWLLSFRLTSFQTRLNTTWYSGVGSTTIFPRLREAALKPLDFRGSIRGCRELQEGCSVKSKLRGKTSREGVL